MNNKLGFTIKKRFHKHGQDCQQSCVIMCSNKTCGLHSRFVIYHPTKELGTVNGLGAHGFIKSPQTTQNHALLGIPVVQQQCDYPTCNTKTLYCCVNKGCTKKKREHKLNKYQTRTNT